MAKRIKFEMGIRPGKSYIDVRGSVEVVPKESLPLKVWSDCVRCPKNDNCDEIAMVLELADVPVITAAAAPPTPKGVSIPVLDPHDE